MYILFGASESLSRGLQAKDLSLQEVLSAVNLAKSFYERQGNDQAFKSCYDKAVHTGQELQRNQNYHGIEELLED